MVRLIWIFFVCLSLRTFSQPALPVPDHIVILIMENHSYNQIIGSNEAPTINTLTKSAHTALFSQSYAISYPSQPNYISLFSGCNQGVTNDSPPKNIPFSTDNLGRQLLDAGKTFISYAEGLPMAGYDGETSGSYVRRHNPAVFWMGNGPNQLPPTVVQPFTSFPEDLSLLPTVCFVIPNNNNNMHDGSISQGDKWIYSHLYNYIQWAKTHNSLFILTFDEDNQSLENRIPTLFAGEMVKEGNYSQKINHLSILRTIEEMYGLPYACDASKAEPVNNCWNTTIDNQGTDSNKIITIIPDPVFHTIKVHILDEHLTGNLTLILLNSLGGKVKETPLQSTATTLDSKSLSAGVYIYQVIKDKKKLVSGKIIIN